jgi:hypothetical protein
MNRTFVYIGLLEVVYEDIRHSLHIAKPANIFQVGHIQLDGIHEILHVHSIFTFLVEEHVHVEGIVNVVAVSGVVGGVGVYDVVAIGIMAI